MRIRTIKPEFFDSPDTARASLAARYLYIGLWCAADDTGRGTCNPKELEGQIFPNDDLAALTDDPHASISGILREVAGAYGIILYEVGGRQYYQIPSWERHQRIYKGRQSRLPGPDHPEARNLSENPTPTSDLREPPGTSGNLPPGTGEQGNRGTGEQGNTPLLATLAAPPSGGATRRGTRLPDDWTPSDTLAAWTRQHAPAAANETEIEKFRDYWKAQPGAKGRKLDWDATWRNWARRTQENTSRQNNGYRTQAQIVQDMRAQAAAATKGNALALIQGGSP